MSKFIALKTTDNLDIVINVDNIIKITDCTLPEDEDKYSVIITTDTTSVKVKAPAIEIFYMIKRAEKEEYKSQNNFSKKEMHTLYEKLKPVLEKADNYLEKQHR